MISPFRGLRPATANDIEMVTNINNFLHINKAEQVDTFRQVCFFIEQQHHFVRDTNPCYYIYTLESQCIYQMGLIALVELNNMKYTIYPHEHTEMDKREKYSDFLKLKKIQANPVILLHRFSEHIQVLLEDIIRAIPSDNSIEIIDCKHKLWAIQQSDLIHKITQYYSAISRYYIGDGHHRYYAIRATFSRPKDCKMLAWLISDSQACILPYHWIVQTSNFINTKQFLKEIAKYFEIFLQSNPVQPQKHNEFGMYLEKLWYQLRPKSIEKIEYSAIFLKNFLKNTFEIDTIISVQNNVEQLAILVDRMSYNVGFSLPTINTPDLLDSIEEGFMFPKNTTYFTPKPAVGLISV